MKSFGWRILKGRNTSSYTFHQEHNQIDDADGTAADDTADDTVDDAADDTADDEMIRSK
jgi:hypothetical protein